MTQISIHKVLLGNIRPRASHFNLNVTRKSGRPGVAVVRSHDLHSRCVPFRPAQSRLLGLECMTRFPVLFLLLFPPFSFFFFTGSLNLRENKEMKKRASFYYSFRHVGTDIDVHVLTIKSRPNER